MENSLNIIFKLVIIAQKELFFPYCM